MDRAQAKKVIMKGLESSDSYSDSDVVFIGKDSPDHADDEKKPVEQKLTGIKRLLAEWDQIYDGI